MNSRYRESTAAGVESAIRASHAELKPHRLEWTLAFMFETRFPQRVTRFAAEGGALQKDYAAYGHKLAKHFDPTKP